MNRLSLRNNRLSIAVGLAALCVPATAHATTYPVSNGAAFDRAIAQAKGGDVLQLANTTFPQLLIRRHRYTGVVKIVGSPSTKLDGLVIKDSKNIELDNVTVTPSTNNRATIGLDSSSFVTIDHVKFDGRVEAAGAGFNMNSASSDVVVRNSEF